MAERVNHAADIAALKSVTSALDDGFKELARSTDEKFSALSRSIENLGNKLDTKSTTNWGTIASFIAVGVTVLGMLGSAFYIPVIQTQQRLESQINMTLQKMDSEDRDLRNNMVTRSEHEHVWQLEGRARDLMYKRLDRLEDQIGKR